jgi:hypothetical protein
MKKGIAIIMFILLLAAVANPSKADYINWVAEKMQAEAQVQNDDFVKFGMMFLGPTLISESTQTKNMVFFTIFTSKISAQNKIIVVGAFKTFIPVSGKV